MNEKAALDLINALKASVCKMEGILQRHEQQISGIVGFIDTLVANSAIPEETEPISTIGKLEVAEDNE